MKQPSTQSLSTEMAESQVARTRAEAPWRKNIRRLFRQRSAIIGLIVLLLIVLMAIFAPFLVTYGPTEDLIGAEGHDQVGKREAPCIHLLGCDESLP